MIQAPRLFDGEISFGDVTQSSSAFLSVHDSLAFFRSVYDAFASYRAAIIRLDGLVDANEKARELPTLTALPSTDGEVVLDDVEVRSPAGKQLIDPLDVRLTPGDSLVITGRSGSGKTTLLRSLAQLWPYTSGTVRYPADENETMFLSQLPYMPLGDLRAVVSYPAEAGDIDDATIRAALDTVALGHLETRLDEGFDWAKVLSPGEQQRIAFARVLLTKPKAVFLDESTSALDEGQEFALYRALRSALPDCIVVSVSHRPHRRAAPRAASAVARRRRVAARPGRRATGAGCPSGNSWPRAPLRACRRTTPRPAGFRWRSPCRPGRCSTRTRRPRTGQESSLPSSRSTSPSMETASPPMVNPEYIARPSEDRTPPTALYPVPQRIPAACGSRVLAAGGILVVAVQRRHQLALGNSERLSPSPRRSPSRR